jgi:ADP-ribose pyrophosphatase YjhB (NUDIX family)
MATKDEKQMPRGGVIPYYIEDDSTIQMLFMKPSDEKYGGPKFQIAKGKLEQGETPEEGAFREAEEELGLFKPNVTEKDDLGQFGKIRIFIARIKDRDMFGEPNFETGEVKWMTPEQFQEEGREWQRPIIKAAVRLIEKKNGNTTSR